MSINPIQLIQLIKNGFNPQQVATKILQAQGKNDPVLNNAMNLAKNGNISSLEALARNLAAQRGLDFDKEFTNFKNQLN